MKDNLKSDLCGKHLQHNHVWISFKISRKEVIINESRLLLSEKFAAYFNLDRAHCTKWFEICSCSFNSGSLIESLCCLFKIHNNILCEILSYKPITHPCSVSTCKHKSVKRGSLSCCTAVTVNTSKKMSKA